MGSRGLGKRIVINPSNYMPFSVPCFNGLAALKCSYLAWEVMVYGDPEECPA